MLIGLLFWRAFCQSYDVTVKIRAPLEDTSWEIMLPVLHAMLPLLHEHLLNTVGTLWLHQVVTATPKCLHGGLSTSIPTTFMITRMDLTRLDSTGQNCFVTLFKLYFILYLNIASAALN